MVVRQEDMYIEEEEESPRVYVGAPYQRGHGIGSFLGGLFRRVLPYLSRGARAIGKEALRAGINVMEDVENNTPFKEALKNRVKESRGNLKRKAEEKLSKLMKGSGYKATALNPTRQFPLDILARRIATRPRRTVKRKVTKKKKKTSKKSTKKKNIRKVGRKTKKSANRRRRIKSRTVSDIFS